MSNTPYHLVTSEKFLDDEKIEELIHWIETNVQNKFKVVSGFDMKLDDSENSLGLNCGIVWLFENINDALMFKLAWGGNHVQ